MNTLYVNLPGVFKKPIQLSNNGLRKPFGDRTIRSVNTQKALAWFTNGFQYSEANE
jgi:hypothetical protein